MSDGGALPVAVGMVHGRFQPFHNGHLEYALAAAEHCRHLVVGITNPDPTHVRAEPANRARSTAEANPFPYHLRYRLVRAALEEAGVDSGRLSVVPFPIHQPELWSHYVPDLTVHFMRVFSAWEAAKGERLAAAGHVVRVLHEGVVEQVTGTEVRRRMSVAGAWRELVPPAVAALLEEARRGEAPVAAS